LETGLYALKTEKQWLYAAVYLPIALPQHTSKRLHEAGLADSLVTEWALLSDTASAENSPPCQHNIKVFSTDQWTAELPDSYCASTLVYYS